MVDGMAETSYASCGDLSLAYQVFGDEQIELVFDGPMVSHVELFWTMPEFKAFFEQLATFCRVALFGKAGLGLSDPIPQGRCGGKADTVDPPRNGPTHPGHRAQPDCRTGV